MANLRRHFWISGRVQGVMYRLSARDAAEGLGLTGWVRNLHDGRVEAVAEGPADAVERFTAWCRRGPPGACVDDLQHSDEPYTGVFPQFSVAATS